MTAALVNLLTMWISFLKLLIRPDEVTTIFPLLQKEDCVKS